MVLFANRTERIECNLRKKTKSTGFIVFRKFFFPPLSLRISQQINKYVQCSVITMKMSF